MARSTGGPTRDRTQSVDAEVPAARRGRAPESAPLPWHAERLLPLQRSAGNRAVSRLVQRDSSRPALDRPAGVAPGLIQRSTDDVLEKLGKDGWEWICDYYKLEIGQLRDLIEKLGMDKIEKDKLPPPFKLQMQLTNVLDEAQAAKSPYTGMAYTDPIYEGNRGKVKDEFDLDTGYRLPPAAQVEKLFTAFCKRRFRYTMNAGGFDRYASGEGDCKTLTESFAKIADQEFGLKVGTGDETKRFLTAGGRTIDPMAVGNCDKGTMWFFTNHYWVVYEGTEYDLLFGRKGINRTAYDLVAKEGKLLNLQGEEVDREYWITAKGVVVWENLPNATGPNPDKYLSDSTPERQLLGAAGFKLPG